MKVMKHLKTFQLFQESILVEAVSMEEFKALKKGQEVYYMGSKYTVEDADGYTADLKSAETGKTMKVNFSMFSKSGKV